MKSLEKDYLPTLVSFFVFSPFYTVDNETIAVSANTDEVDGVNGGYSLIAPGLLFLILVLYKIQRPSSDYPTNFVVGESHMKMFVILFIPAN